MTVSFPKTMDFSGFNAPSRVECDIFDLVVHGEIPPEIDGRWYRMTPDPQFPPMLGEDTYLSGDGMMSMFTIEHGHVDYRSRYVMTERLKNDRRARRSLYGRYRNPFTDDSSVAGATGRSVANTTPVFHAGRLLATKEDGRPIELDPRTLATLGEYDFGGQLRSATMTAHPHIDPDSGEMFLFGTQAAGLTSKTMSYSVVAKDGTLVREQWFDGPFAGMMHDFAVTKEHAIFPFFPVAVDEQRVREGGAFWQWQAGLGTHVGIMKRDGDVADMQWFTGPDWSFFHFMNAYSVGDEVHVDFTIAEEVPFPFIRKDSGLTGPMQMDKAGLVRWTFNLKHNEAGWVERRLGPPGDFPNVARRDMMKDYTAGYYQLYDPRIAPPIAVGPVGVGFNMIARIDVKTGELRPYVPGPTCTVQEHVHVPSSQPGHEGYLLFAVDLHETMGSEVQIVLAEHPERGPIARIELPLRLRDQVHGCWVPGAAIG
jgi:carotenoid cleavage dioxygenase-like enzyme